MVGKEKRKISAAKAPTGHPPTTSILANSLYSFRRRRGLTLADIAEATELDKGYLSRLERGKKVPSISTLLKIAKALDVQVSQLLGEATAEDAITVIRQSDRIHVEPADALSHLEAILPTSSKRRISAFLVEPGVGFDTSNARHSGEELMLVLDGTIVIEFPDRRIELAAGDCIHFDGHLRHRLSYLEGQPGRALVIIANDLPS